MAGAYQRQDISDAARVLLDLRLPGRKGVWGVSHMITGSLSMRYSEAMTRISTGIASRRERISAPQALVGHRYVLRQKRRIIPDRSPHTLPLCSGSLSRNDTI